MLRDSLRTSFQRSRLSFQNRRKSKLLSECFKSLCCKESRVVYAPAAPISYILYRAMEKVC